MQAFLDSTLVKIPWKTVTGAVLLIAVGIALKCSWIDQDTAISIGTIAAGLMGIGLRHAQAKTARSLTRSSSSDQSLVTSD